MCCFAKSVLSVSNTHLFARLSGNGTQFLVYQMQFKSEQVNAMILPLPTALPARDEAVRFVSFENYDHFSPDLNAGFPTDSPPPTRALRVDSKAVEKLEVHVGQFVASFVSTLADFDRLDPQFVIPKESWLITRIAAKLVANKQVGLSDIVFPEMEELHFQFALLA